MWKLHTVLFACFLSAASVQAEENVEYFPDQENCELGAYLQCRQLAALFQYLGEASLYARSKEPEAGQSYRFFWHRSFHNSVIFRMDMAEGGQASLIVKTLARSNRYSVANEKTIHLKPDQLSTFTAWAKLAEKWLLLDEKPSESVGMDGAGWCFEVASQNSFGAACRWSPVALPLKPDPRMPDMPPELAMNDNLRRFGMEFIKLSGMDFGEIY